MKHRIHRGTAFIAVQPFASVRGVAVREVVRNGTAHP